MIILFCDSVTAFPSFILLPQFIACQFRQCSIKSNQITQDSKTILFLSSFSKSQLNIFSFFLIFAVCWMAVLFHMHAHAHPLYIHFNLRRCTYERHRYPSPSFFISSFLHSSSSLLNIIRFELLLLSVYCRLCLIEQSKENTHKPLYNTYLPFQIDVNAVIVAECVMLFNNKKQDIKCKINNLTLHCRWHCLLVMIGCGDCCRWLCVWFEVLDGSEFSRFGLCCCCACRVGGIVTASSDTLVDSTLSNVLNLIFKICY